MAEKIELGMAPAPAAAPAAAAPMAAPVAVEPGGKVELGSAAGTPQTTGESPFTFARGLIEEFTQGGTLGFSDEIEAAIAAAAAMAYEQANPQRGQQAIPVTPQTFGERYQEALTSLRGDRDRFTQENPGASLAANVAGGLATGGAALKGLQAARVPVSGIPGVVTAGGSIGGAAGAGTADGDSMVEGAVTGALTGAAGGFLTSLGVSGISALGRRLAPGVKNRMKALAAASGLTPSQIATRVQALGPKATIADVDAVFTRAADISASRLGPGARRVRELIRRDESQFTRLMEPIRRTLGSQDQAANTIAGLKSLREQQASPLYERAFNAGLRNTDRLRDLLARPETQKAWRQVQSIGKSDPDINLAALSNGAEPSFRGWQAITEILGDRQKSLYANQKGKFGGTVKRLRNAVLEELDAQSDDFAQARGLWAGTKRADDMVETGERFLKMPIDELRAELRGMSDVDKAFFRMGAGKAVEARLATTNDTNDLARMFRNQAFRAKAMEIFPDKASAVDFVNTVRAETIKKATSNAVGRGSQTRPREVAEEQLTGQAIAPDDMSKAGLIEKMTTAISSPREATIQQIGEMLLSPDPAVQAKAIAMMSGGGAPRFGMSPVSAAAANVAGQGPAIPR